ncbi:MAG: cobalamin biosynthesis protein [Chromatiaceae bacterium]|nr:cobalamin biosynthesis protein [Chromatiaceae bacterium]
MTETIANGSRRHIDGDERIYFDGYWIKYYEPPPESLNTKRHLIQALTRRLFNHVEHGINIPGGRLSEARAAYEAETDPERKRVKGAMLAGALFNRAADIFNCLVDLQATGVEIGHENSLMRDCGQYLLEALDLGKVVRHRGGDEGIDELWGEPFKAFSIPIADFYRSRYIKIAMTMRDIDRIAAALKDTFAPSRQIPNIDPLVDALATTAKRKCEILRTDPAIFEVWPAFVVASDRLRQLEPQLPNHSDAAAIREALEGHRLLNGGTDLISFIVRARVPMPKSTREYIDRCLNFRRAFFEPPADDTVA